MVDGIQQLLATLPDEKKEARIAVRVAQQVKEVIDTAAEMVGTTTNQFMAQAAYRAARDLIVQERVVQLCAKETRQFLDLLDNPPPPSDRLKQADSAYKNAFHRAED